MSKFIDKLSQISQGGPQPMGFGAGKLISSQPKMLLVASLTGVDVGRLADYVAGADAGLLSVSSLPSGTESLKEASQAVPGIPWGGWLKGVGGKETKRVKKLDCDFVVFPAGDTSLALAGGEVGRVLEIEASLDQGLLRTIDELSVDAVLITGEEGGAILTWRHLMLFQRVAEAVAKPLLVSAPSKVTADELQMLWEAGVSGVIVEAGSGGLNGLRRTIDKASFTPQGRRRKEKALLPYLRTETAEAAEEEE